MPDLDSLTARVSELESRLNLWERAVQVEMLALIRELPPLEGPMEEGK